MGRGDGCRASGQGRGHMATARALAPRAPGAERAPAGAPARDGARWLSQIPRCEPAAYPDRDGESPRRAHRSGDDRGGRDGARHACGRRKEGPRGRGHRRRCRPVLFLRGLHGGRLDRDGDVGGLMGVYRATPPGEFVAQRACARPARRRAGSGHWAPWAVCSCRGSSRTGHRCTFGRRGAP